MIQLRTEALTVTISEKGAEITSVKDRQGTEFIWQADARVWPRHAPVLFPIVGRLKDDTMVYRDKSYHLSQHGFARDRAFSLMKHDETECLFELVSNTESRTVYPFDFIFHISHSVVNNVLRTTYEITNPSPDTLLFSVGAHPGFSCRLGKSESLEDFRLEFEKTGLSQTLLRDGLRTNSRKKLYLKDGKLKLSSSLFDQDALVFENSQVNSINLVSEKSGHSVRMDCRDWPYFGVWSKKGCHDFVCLEPWYGIADHQDASGDFSAKEGIIKLQPGTAFSCAFSVTFS